MPTECSQSDDYPIAADCRGDVTDENGHERRTPVKQTYEQNQVESWWSDSSYHSVNKDVKLKDAGGWKQL